MGVRAVITSKGQVTLPKAVRERLGVKTGDAVEFIMEENGRTWLRPRKLRAIDFADILGEPPRGKGATVEDFDEAIMDAVAEDDERIRREWNDSVK